MNEKSVPVNGGPVNRYVRALLLIGLLAVGACGDEATTPAVPSTLALSTDEVVLADGSAREISATVLDQRGSVISAPEVKDRITWSIRDPAIATPDRFAICRCHELLLLSHSAMVQSEHGG